MESMLKSLGSLFAAPPRPPPTAEDVQNYWAEDDMTKLEGAAAAADKAPAAKKAAAARRKSDAAADTPETEYATDDLTPAELTSLGRAMANARGDRELPASPMPRDRT